MIQKHVKGWLYRKKYRTMQTSTGTIQRWVRGFLARRKARSMRRNKAATILQSAYRGHIQRKKYLELRRMTIRLQANMRGLRARKEYRHLVEKKSATIIQKHARGWVARMKYTRDLRAVVVAQGAVRRKIARKKLKKLKIEAKSVEKQRELNKGLENKIISLQQRLTDANSECKALKQQVSAGAALSEELGKAKKAEEEVKARGDRIKTIEEELRQVRAELQKEREEKVDLVNEKVNAEEEVSTLKQQIEKDKDEFEKTLAEAKTAAENSAKIEPVELEKLSAEKEEIHAEYEQERIAYQKLLKEYNRLELQRDNLQDEVNLLRGTPNDETVYDLKEDESAYGDSISGRSSMVSTLERDRTLESMTEGNATQDIGLLMKFQGALREEQRLRETMEKEKEALERKIDDLESANNNNNEAYKPIDMFRLDEVSAENTRLRESLDTLRESVAQSAEGTENSAVREVMDQYSSLMEELDRKKEECLNLKTLVANSQVDNRDSIGVEGEPDPEELFQAYETQKNVIQQLQSSLNEEREKCKEIESSMKAEVEKLSVANREAQQLLQTNMKRNPGSATEAIMQHELQRLTGENFDLLEKIENLSDQLKVLKKQLKIYMKKLEDRGESLTDNEDADQDSRSEAGETDASLPVITRREHESMGMLEYDKAQEDKVLRALIVDLKPKVASQMLPGLPAYFLFMMIRHLDYMNDEKNVRTLIQGGIACIKKTIKKHKGQTDIELKTLWLSNTLRVLHCLKQYSGEEQFQLHSSTKQVEHCLRNFDLTAYRRVLSDIAVWIYQGITKLMEDELHPLLVAALLEHEGIGGLSGDKPRALRGRTGSTGNDLETEHLDPKVALDRLLSSLTRFNQILQKHGLDPEIIAQIFRQIFYFVCANCLNNLLLRKDMCHWSRGMQIRYNIAQIEQWARDQKIEDTDTKVIDTLLPIIQATQLLQARKSEEDVSGICDMCDKLRVSQIIKILNVYTPADEFEERVSPAFVRKIRTKLQERAMEEAKNQAPLLMDAKFSFAVKFPFNPSKIHFDELDLPGAYTNLPSLVRKV